MNQQIATKPARDICFIPFGSKDEIKLSIEIVKKFCCIPTKSGNVCTDAQAVKYMMLCQAQRLNPFAGDAFLTGYDGKNGPAFSLIVAHIAFIKRAEVSSDYQGMESGIILQGEDGAITEREGDFCTADEKVVGGWARVHRKDRKPMYRRLSVAAMKPNYETPFWSELKAPGQICKCAETDALRASFPTMLGGLYSEPETLSGAIDVSSVTVKTGEPEPQQIPAQSTTTSPPGQPPEQSSFCAAIEEAGFTFDDFRKQALIAKWIADADSYGSFDEIPAADLKRLYRIRATIIESLTKAKEGLGI